MKKKMSMLMVLCMTLVMSLCMMGCGGDESYREIKVLKLSGKTIVDVVDEDYSTDAYEGMNLESNTKVNVESGNVTILADADKYLYAEAGTKFNLTATGDATNSKTKINVESGSVTSEIQNKLSGESTYEVSTSNVTMSVRGTIFTVSLVQGDDGKMKTNLNVFDGTVEANSTDADGNIVDTFSIEAGKGISINTDDTGVWTEGVRDADLSELSPETVEYIVNLAEEHGSEADIAISEEELEQYYEDIENGVYDNDDFDDVDLDDEDLIDEDFDDDELDDIDVEDDIDDDDIDNSSEEGEEDFGDEEGSDDTSDDTMVDDEGTSEISDEGEDSVTPEDTGSDVEAPSPEDSTPEDEAPSDEGGEDDYGEDEDY